jgi:DNA mismatch repair protein MutS
MSELRDILRHADPYTLVLGDELCSGTESISAQALVASGIQWLAARHAKCMFATHLHGIPDLLSMKEHKMEVWHLHVEYDAVSGRLLYDRSLRPGKGSSLYGLEVARAMDLPFEFMEQAVQNRHRLMGTLSAQEAPTSSWNRQMVRKQCERCMTPIQSELEVHHVQERHTARHGILPDGMPMNDPRNLMVLCETCHDAVHANHVEIGPILHTSEGPVRIIHETTASLSALSASQPGAPLMKGKWTIEERQTIMDTLRTYSSMSFKSLRAMLDAKYDIQISETMLRKMRREAS